MSDGVMVAIEHLGLLLANAARRIEELERQLSAAHSELAGLDGTPDAEPAGKAH